MRAWTSRVLLLAIASLLIIQPAFAEDPVDPPEDQEVDLEALRQDRMQKAAKYKVSSRVKRYLAAAAKEVDEDHPEEAKRLLDRLGESRLNPMERAFVDRVLAYVAYGNDESELAIEYFIKALDSGVMSLSDESKIRFYLAQLHASVQNWPEVILWLKRWLVYEEHPDPLGHYLMGIAYYQLEKFDDAIEQAKLAVELSPEPKEAWLRLLAALYSRNQDHAKAAPVLEQLVLHFPKKQYWVQLSLIYGANENYPRSLAVQQVAYAQGLLTEDKELRRLARGYLFADLPYPAAKVLQKGLDEGTIERDSSAYELLANSWIAAREYDRSIEPLRKAAALSEDGNLYVRLGQVYMQSEKWSEATGLLKKGIDKGGLKEPGNAQLLLGIAYYNDSQLDSARASFMRARDHKDTRDVANNWLSHLDREERTAS